MFSGANWTLSSMQPDNLKVEYQANPLGIDVLQPRFSWQMRHQPERRGQKQLGYRITVCNDAGVLFWDSGEVSSDQSVHILYQGKSLQPRSRYQWRVAVWDQDSQVSETESWFETGLMNSDISAWQGAQWIGGGDNDKPLYADYLPLYDLSVDVEIAPGSQCASIIFAANDPRFLDKYKNIYQQESALNESYFRVELDIAGLDEVQGHARLNIYRAGYLPEDNPAVPVAQFRIKHQVINQDNRYALHHLFIHSEYGTLTIQLDGNSDFYLGAQRPRTPVLFSEKARAPMMHGARVCLNEEGGDHDTLPYGMLNAIGFRVEPEQHASFSNLRVSNIHAPNNNVFSESLNLPYSGIFAAHQASPHFRVENQRYQISGGTKGTFIVADPSQNGMPMLRSEFDLQGKTIARARLYVTARGIYEFYINGHRIGNDYYNPGLTQYNETHLYQTYDVSSYILSGNNAMGALLAEGWWSGLLSYGNTWHCFGDQQSLLAMLVVTLADGTELVFNTDTQNWQFFNQGPITYSSLTMGEVYDARKEAEISNWSQAGFNADGWVPARQVPLENSATSGSRPSMMIEAQHLSYENMALEGQVGEPARVFKTLNAQSVEEVRPGVFVYDIGQNIVGVPQLDLANGNEGQQITLRFAEMLYPDLPESGPNVGMILTENYRSALSQDIYIMKAGPQRFQPRFTSHGFQYIEITGIDEALPLSAVKGIVISSVSRLTANYTSSNKNVNQLWSNIVWSNIDNFLSVPTDCPQRNERMGWTGDINVFGRSATFISDSSQFIRRYLKAMRDTQSPAGRYPDIAPVGGGFGGILWGSAGITLAWEAYLQFNDFGLLAEHYASMQAYMDFLDSVTDENSGFITDDGLGDWLGPQHQQVGSAFLATAYQVYILNIMQQVARILGDEKQAARFHRQHLNRKAFFNDTFVSPDKKALGWLTYGNIWEPSDCTPEFKEADVQTAYAVGLALGAFDDSLTATMAAHLDRTVKSKNKDDSGIERPEYSLMTGFIGTAWVADALTENGYSDTAYRLIQSETYPSWLYSVVQGATTIWERLNGYTVEHGFAGNNGMNSFNHYSFGAVAQWMICHSAGIQRDKPGFKHFLLKPGIDNQRSITQVDAYYDSPYGKIQSSWQTEAGQLRYQARVPANTSATLVLPVQDTEMVTESGRALDECDGISRVEKHPQGVSLQLLSGCYSFVCKLPGQAD